MKHVTSFVVILSAVVLAVFGVLIRYFGRVELVAGYDPDAVTDEEELGAFVGRNTLFIAGLTAIVALVEYLHLFDSSLGVWTGYTILVVVLSLWTVLGAQQYDASS